MSIPFEIASRLGSWAKKAEVQQYATGIIVTTLGVLITVRCADRFYDHIVGYRDMDTRWGGDEVINWIVKLNAMMREEQRRG